MTISELVPFLDFVDLANFYQLNKTCKAIMTPSNSKCLRFDVLFAQQKRDFAAENWRESLVTEVERHQAFGQIMITAKNLLLSPTPRYVESAEQKFKNTYKRYNREL